MNQLPAILDEIAQVAGKEAAWEIARANGGRVVYIPASPISDHWLTQLVGYDRAVKICDHFRVGDTGQRILIPLAKYTSQRERLSRALNAGMSAPEAAEVSGMHVRSAYRARARKRKDDDDNQGNLF
ncbi:helix-turn-helix domain-containing protein [Martelella mediterranea]|uniref:Mor transcription activator family protein n=1 Tax=Martelella mediterranea TaxID=293089 RepID=A0A4R3NVJ9_9HYPH|nr:helix-turn-helix domain-containing protein [Martelella mediterranea]TCT41171.1 hypothetical protein EDC90_1007148 [Martelella mediterranea]